MDTHYIKRQTANYAALTISVLSAAFGIFFLFWILKDVFVFGFKAINIDFFTELPAPPGMEGGGLANAILGTLLITVLATAIGVPAGIMAGTYLSEYGRKSRMASVVRFTSDILVSAPSIVIGVFVYALLVKPLGGFSAIAGAVALAIIMLPVVVRTSERC